MLGVRLAIWAMDPRKLLLAQHTKVTLALSISKQPNQCMHELVWKSFCI